MLFDFSAIKRSVQGLDERLKSLRSEVAELKRKREAIHMAPAAKADIKALLSGWVRSSGATFFDELKLNVERFARNPQSMKNPGPLMKLATLNGAQQPYGDVTDSHELGQAICAVFGASIDEAMTRAVDQMEWPADAIASSDRAHRVAALDERIQKLEAEMTEIRDKAHDVGITLE